MEKQNDKLSSTPYDDSFRTMLADCLQLVIPLINLAFGTHYSGKEKIICHPNELFLNRGDGTDIKRITDSAFTIEGMDGKTDGDQEENERFIMECQSTNDDIAIRIFEYLVLDLLRAFDLGNIVTGDDGDAIIEQRFARAAVIYLRSSSSTPKRIAFRLRGDGNDSLRINVPVIKLQDFTLDELFEKELYFLVPFYLFIHEGEFPAANTDNGKLSALLAQYSSVLQRLDKAVEEGKVSPANRYTIIRLLEKVSSSLTTKYENVKKGVETIMGGHIIDYPGRKELLASREEGMAEGMAKGMAKGMAQGAKEAMSTAMNRVVARMINAGRPGSEIINFTELDRPAIDAIAKGIGRAVTWN